MSYNSSSYREKFVPLIFSNVFQKYSYYIFCLTLEIGFQKKQYRAL